jgi:hypothetical protein
MKTNKLLAAVVVLQGLILIGQWSGGTGYLSTARADIPDPGARQLQMIEQLSLLNTKVEEVVSILQGGQLQVKVVKAEEDKGGARAK